MVISFWPPLQLIAYARVAHGILYTFDLEIMKSNIFKDRYLQRRDFIQKIEQKVSVIILSSEEVKHTFLSCEIQTQLVSTVMVLRSEIKKWFECHSYILHDDDLDLRNRLAWFSFGIIDRFNTARNFIQDENMCIDERFHLACKYYFEDEARILWACMSKEDKFYFKKYIPKTMSMDLWFKILNRNTEIDWNKLPLHGRLTRNFFYRNYLGIRYYFGKFSGCPKRYLCVFNAIQSESVHHFDLYSCLSQFNLDELNTIFNCLLSSQTCKVFETFLNWPFQIIFLDVVNTFRQHINEEIFCELIICILFGKIARGLQDHRYLELLQCFWYTASENFKQYVKEDEQLYAVVRYVLENFDSFDMTEYLELIKVYVEE